jgi:hypothetical protein
MSYTNLNNPANYQLQSFGQEGMRTISTTQAYVEGEYYRVLVATEDSTLSATSMVGDDLASIDVYAGTTIYGLFTAVTVTAGEVTAYLAGRTDIDDVWAYIRAYGEANGAVIEGEDCAKAAISPLLDKYYAKASLVMVPSLYKTSIVYSERPLSTDGEFTFTRASNATRVGPDGLIEKVRTNTFLYSEDFSDAAWVKERISVSSNVTTAPDGTSTADKIVENTDNNSHRVRQNANSTQNVEYTLSCYLKASERTKARIVAGGLNASADFDLSTGVIIGSPTLCTASITNVGSGWYRCAITYTQTSATSAVQLHLVATLNAAGDFVYTGDGTSGIFVWGAMLETGVLTDYIPTTTTAVSVGPVANLPRLNYPINSDGSVGCPSLLLEPQRTNLVTYSEQFDNAGWAKSGASVLANAVLGPDGYTSADKLVEDTSTGAHIATQSNLFTATGAWHTASIFVKAAERTYAAFSTRGNFTSNDNTLIFNLTTGEWELDDSGQNYALNAEAFPNGWYRISLNTDTTSGAYDGFGIGIATGSTSWIDAVYTGDGTSGIYIWGAQMEAGQYESSLIPTLVASVTRGEDYCSKTGISSLIGQTEGVVFVEYNQSLIGQSATRRIFALSDGTTSNRITAYVSSSNGIDFYVRNSGGDLFLGTAASPIGNTKGVHKIAAAYKNGDYAVYLDGVQIISGAGTAGTLPTCSRFDLGNQLGSNHLYEPMMQVLLFKTRLSNAQLAELTTL